MRLNAFKNLFFLLCVLSIKACDVSSVMLVILVLVLRYKACDDVSSFTVFFLLLSVISLVLFIYM